MTIAEAVPTEGIRFSGDDIETAGLRPEGWYLFDLKSHKTQQVDAGVSKRTGEAYDAFSTVQVNILSKARAIYDEEGQFMGQENLPYGFPMNFSISDSQSGLAKLKNTYKAITETNLTGDGEVQATLDNLIGGSFWARLYHKRGGDGVLREELDTWRLRSRTFGPPQTVTVAKQQNGES